MARYSLMIHVNADRPWEISPRHPRFSHICWCVTTCSVLTTWRGFFNFSIRAQPLSFHNDCLTCLPVIHLPRSKPYDSSCLAELSKVSSFCQLTQFAVTEIFIYKQLAVTVYYCQRKPRFKELQIFPFMYATRLTTYFLWLIAYL